MTVCGTSCHCKPVRGVFTTRHTNKPIKLDSPYLCLNPPLLNVRLHTTSTEGKLVGATVKSQHEDLIDIKRLMGIHYSERSRQDLTGLLIYKPC